MKAVKKRISRDLKDLINEECAVINIALIDPSDVYNFHATIVGPEGRELL